MSLLMQALKKAERARQSGLQEEDLPDNGQEPADDTVAGGAPRRAPDLDAGMPDVPPARAPGSSSGPLELSLEPLDAPPARADAPQNEARQAEATRAEAVQSDTLRADPPLPPPPPAIEPAVEASHNPVPPQARHEGGRLRGDAGEIPVRDARAAPRPGPAGADSRRGPGAPERRAVPRSAPVQADAASGIDLPRLRIAGLAGVLVMIAGTFGYLYWQAVNGPGPGASLPMVPMPPPSATGATTAGGDLGIVVAPSGAPFGALGTPAPTADTAAVPPPIDPAAPPAPAPVAPPVAPPAAPVAAAPATTRAPGAAPRASRPAPLAGPTPAQLAAIEDPEIRREAMRDAMERAGRMEQMGEAPGAAGAFGEPDGAAAAPAASTSTSTSTAAAEANGRGDVQVARGASSPAIHPAVQAGYAAFAAGDLAAAARQYATALRNDPNNRDALLGSAAIAARERRDDDAARSYLRLLSNNPRDAEAIAGLTALRPGDGDRAEVRLKGVLRDNPDAAPVHFALGNLHARQRRWQEAQQAYFHAWSAAPANADYAFNLAVGLDRLNQARLASQYYQRALALAASGAAAFDRAAVQRRLAELSAAQAPAAAAAAADPAAIAAPAPASAPAAPGN